MSSVAVARYGSFFRLAESKFILRIFRKLFIYSALLASCETPYFVSSLQPLLLQLPDLLAFCEAPYFVSFSVYLCGAVVTVQHSGLRNAAHSSLPVVRGLRFASSLLNGCPRGIRQRCAPYAILCGLLWPTAFSDRVYYNMLCAECEHFLYLFSSPGT